MQNIVMDSTNILSLKKLKDRILDLLVTDATVTGTLKDALNVDVPGATGLAVVFFPGTPSEPGEYRATIPHTVTLIENAIYTFVVVAIAPSGRRTFYEQCKAIRG
jgi:hypothetical protein